MQVLFDIDREKMVKLLALDPEYHRDPRTFGDGELLSEFTATYLKPFGMSVVETSSVTPLDEPDAVRQSGPQREEILPEEVSEEQSVSEPEPLHVEETAETPAAEPEEPEPEDDGNMIYAEGLKLMEDDGQLKCQVGPFEMKMEITYPGGTCTVNLTNAEYDEYYRIKKECRRKVWETGIDRSGSESLTYLIRERSGEGKKSPFAGLKAAAEAYAGVT